MGQLADCIREFYAALTGDDLGIAGNSFAHNAVYVQLDTGSTGRGLEQVLEALRCWRNCFDGLAIIDAQTSQATSDDPCSSERCFVISYIMTGQYVGTVPGMELVAPAHDRLVSVPMHDMVWVDPDGLITQINNRMHWSALV